MLAKLEAVLDPPPGIYDGPVDVKLRLKDEPVKGYIVVRTSDGTSGWHYDSSCQIQGFLWLGTCVTLDASQDLQYRFFFDGADIAADDALPSIQGETHTVHYEIK